MIDTWDDVRLFLALHRSRTLSEAGARLALDASTMSRRLVALETALGCVLFERSRTGIVATEVADQLAPMAEEMEHVMARFVGTAEAVERQVEGSVRIACPPDAAEVWLAPLLPALRAAYPLLNVEILAGERPVDMARREADLALRTYRPDSGDLIVTRLMTVPWVVAASPAVAKNLGLRKSWRDIPWLTGEGRNARTTAGRWFSDNIRDQEPILRANLSIQIASVAAGLGVALLPVPSLAHFGLVPVRLQRAFRAKVTFPEEDLLLVTHRALRQIPRVRAVWDFLRETSSSKGASKKKRASKRTR